MSFEPKKQAYSAPINAVTLGTGDKAIVIGGLGAQLLAGSQSDGSTAGLVVLVLGRHEQSVLAGQGLSDLAQQLGVLLDVLAAQDDQGQIGDGGDGNSVSNAGLDGAVGTENTLTPCIP